MNLRTAFDANNNPIRPTRDYLRYLTHTEESNTGTGTSSRKMYNTPEFYSKTSDPLHTEYKARGNRRNENKFNNQVVNELDLRHYSSDEVRLMTVEERLTLLNKCLSLERQIKFT